MARNPNVSYGTWRHHQNRKEDELQERRREAQKTRNLQLGIEGGKFLGKQLLDARKGNVAKSETDLAKLTTSDVGDIKAGTNLYTKKDNFISNITGKYSQQNPEVISQMQNQAGTIDTSTIEHDLEGNVTYGGDMHTQHSQMTDLYGSNAADAYMETWNKEHVQPSTVADSAQMPSIGGSDPTMDYDSTGMPAGMYDDLVQNRQDGGVGVRSNFGQNTNQGIGATSAPNFVGGDRMVKGDKKSWFHDESPENYEYSIGRNVDRAAGEGIESSYNPTGQELDQMRLDQENLLKGEGLDPSDPMAGEKYENIQYVKSQGGANMFSPQADLVKNPLAFSSVSGDSQSDYYIQESDKALASLREEVGATSKSGVGVRYNQGEGGVGIQSPNYLEAYEDGTIAADIGVPGDNIDYDMLEARQADQQRWLDTEQGQYFQGKRSRPTDRMRGRGNVNPITMEEVPTIDTDKLPGIKPGMTLREQIDLGRDVRDAKIKHELEHGTDYGAVISGSKSAAQFDIKDASDMTQAEIDERMSAIRETREGIDSFNTDLDKPDSEILKDMYERQVSDLGLDMDNELETITAVDVNDVANNIKENTQTSLAQTAIAKSKNALGTGMEVAGAVGDVKQLVDGDANEKTESIANLTKTVTKKAQEKIAKKATEKAAEEAAKKLTQEGAEKIATEGAKTATSIGGTALKGLGGGAAAVTGFYGAKKGMEGFESARKRGEVDEMVSQGVTTAGSAVAGVGGVLTGIGALATATGVGAVIGAPLMAVGGAMTTYGGAAAMAGSAYTMADNLVEGLADKGRGVIDKGINESRSSGRGRSRRRVGRA